MLSKQFSFLKRALLIEKASKMMLLRWAVKINLRSKLQWAIYFV